MQEGAECISLAGDLPLSSFLSLVFGESFSGVCSGRFIVSVAARSGGQGRCSITCWSDTDITSPNKFASSRKSR